MPIRGVPRGLRTARRLRAAGKDLNVHLLASVLARHGVAAVGLEHERTTLEDAFVALTGRRTED